MFETIKDIFVVVDRNSGWAGRVFCLAFNEKYPDFDQISSKPGYFMNFARCSSSEAYGTMLTYPLFSCKHFSSIAFTILMSLEENFLAKNLLEFIKWS